MKLLKLQANVRNTPAQMGDGRPQGLAISTPVEDGRPQGLAISTPVEDGRPQGLAISTPVEDGRPQGATPPLHTTPVPTMYEQFPHRVIVGTGVGRGSGMPPCGRPSSPTLVAHPIPCGRPSPLTIVYLLVITCFLLTSCSIGGQQGAMPTATAVPGSNLPPPQSVSEEALLQTEQVLLMTPHPLRDLYSLVRRLKLHTPRPIPHVGRTTPLNEHVGQEDMFWISNQDTYTYSRIRARLVDVTPHVYMYVEDGQPVDLAALQSSANVFETKIYPTDRAAFGSEWTPGIDDDVHLTILNAVGLGSSVGGYFSAEDEYPTSVNRYSNEREMFYVSLDSSIPGSPDYNATLAHEFQHMIHWHAHPLDLSWTNEGMSVLAQHINGYPVSGFDAAFMQSPDTQLNDWSDDASAAVAHYGAGYLFMDYFSEHYGGTAILKELLTDPASPPINFNDVLKRHGYTDTFLDVLQKWYIANYVNDSNVGLPNQPCNAARASSSAQQGCKEDSGEYGYSTIQVQGVTPQHTIRRFPSSENDTVHQYAAEYYDIEPGNRHGTLHIDVQGTPMVRIVGNDPYQSSYEWWGNRYDNMDSTLTHSFDLTHIAGKRATLQFATWFDLEQNYDYAYVEASTDGQNWTTLKGTYTTTNNPTGANLGNGYTGDSEQPGANTPTTSGNAPQWVQESVDLSTYVGKHVQIRFEEVTDDAVNWQGFAIDNIRIPEIGFRDMAMSDNGWVSNGFIRSQNELPQHFSLQALLYSGNTFTVSSAQVNLATGQGTLTVPDFGGKIDHVVVILSAYAAETTLPAHYTITTSIGK